MAGKLSYEELEQKVQDLETELDLHQNESRNHLKGAVRYRAILEQAVDAIVVVNKNAEVIEWPIQAEVLCGWSRSEIVGRPIFKIMPERLRHMHSGLFDQVMNGGRGVVFGKRIETTVLDRFENEVPVELSVALTKIDQDPEVTLFMHDITERKRTHEMLHEISITDELTGLFNRRGFLAMAEKKLHAACRNNEEIFLLYADFDNMKGINDTLGHKAGDIALVDTAELLQETFRQADLIGRVGGDEFLVLLCDPAGVSSEETVIRRLEENIRSYNKRPGVKYKIQLSLGTVRYSPEHPCAIEELMSKADAKMYKSKNLKKKKGLDGYA